MPVQKPVPAPPAPVVDEAAIAHRAEQEAIHAAAVEAQKAADARKLAADTILPPDFRLPRKATTIGQIFAGLENYKTTAEKIAWLRHNDKPVVRYLFRLGFDSTIEWDMPKGLPPYKALTMTRGGRTLKILPGMAPTELFVEARRLYMFVKGTSVERIKREKIFQAMIEDMEPIEVDVLLCIKDHKLTKFVKQDVVAQAFPGIFNGEFSPRFMRR